MFCFRAVIIISTLWKFQLKIFSTFSEKILLKYWKIKQSKIHRKNPRKLKIFWRVCISPFILPIFVCKVFPYGPPFFLSVLWYFQQLFIHIFNSYVFFNAICFHVSNLVNGLFQENICQIKCQAFWIHFWMIQNHHYKLKLKNKHHFLTPFLIKICLGYLCHTNWLKAPLGFCVVSSKHRGSGSSDLTSWNAIWISRFTVTGKLDEGLCVGIQIILSFRYLHQLWILLERKLVSNFAIFYTWAVLEHCSNTFFHCMKSSQVLANCHTIKTLHFAYYLVC